MKPKILCAVAFLGIVSILQSMPPTTPETGKVLLLDNDLIIEGEIMRVGAEFSVKRGGAGEVTIPATRVVKLVQSKAEAFEVLRQKVNKSDVDARLKLARWGLLHEMHPEALIEAEAALALRPENSQAKSLVKGLKQLIEKPIALNHPDKSAALNEVEEVTMPTSFNANAFAPFATRVQPILMNLCASCHATGKGGNYKLVRVYEASTNRKGTLYNLASTLGQISREKPASSPLLARSVSAHGDSAKAPIHDPQAGAYGILEAWVSTAMRSEEIPSTDRGVFAANKPIFVETEKPSEEAVKKTPPRPPLIGGNVPLKLEEESQTAVKTPTATKKDKETETTSRDEFDPSIFNQQTTPKK